ncbi:MAG TPA: metallophosphoesterase, partial [Myxococcota bacterium]|nr:metallophosphoesterase [Myxococcota bacterium]
MTRILNRFVLVLTAMLVAAYAYLAWRIGAGAAGKLALAVPFVLIWLVPVLYWVEDRESGTAADELLHFAAYLSMGWLNFALLVSLARDAVQLLTPWDPGAGAVLAGSFLALGAGMAASLRGPHVRHVDIPVDGLDPALEGTRIVQITDLHVGPTLGRRYVRRVVRMANALEPDFFALTGDFVDGPAARLARHVAPLAGLAPAGRAFFVPGNHETYSGAAPWLEQFRSLGFRVLLNEHETVDVRGARVLVGGVTDPSAARPRPDLAAGRGEDAALRVLLAHNPKIAPLAQEAGFDL